jgi:hypothetical protein
MPPLWEIHPILWPWAVLAWLLHSAADALGPERPLERIEPPPEGGYSKACPGTYLKPSW